MAIPYKYYIYRRSDSVRVQYFPSHAVHSAMLTASAYGKSASHMKCERVCVCVFDATADATLALSVPACEHIHMLATCFTRKDNVGDDAHAHTNIHAHTHTPHIFVFMRARVCMLVCVGEHEHFVPSNGYLS